jgi:hypothetical protein
MYYPKSQITPNLYTNGNEFVYEDSGLFYSGYYFKTSKGEYFTGRNQDDRPNERLIQFFYDGINLDLFPPNTPVTLLNEESTIVYEYNTINPTTITYIPIYNPVLPTQQDYQNGEFRRYFCKKTNEILYIETDKSTYDKLVAKDVQIAWPLYQPFEIPWQLTGNIEQVEKTNRNIVELTSFQSKFPRLADYLRFNFTKYYNQLGTTTSGSYINGVNQGYVLDNRDGRSTGVFNSQDDSGSVRRDSSITR